MLTLVGQYDSPFVRRVAITLDLYDIAFQQSPLSVMGDAAEMRKINPLGRVPALARPDGSVEIDSQAIIAGLDEAAGPERALWPHDADARRQARFIAALGVGLAEKAVALVYERAFHRSASTLFLERANAQIDATLKTLEAARKGAPTAFWFGKSVGHADIAVACALRFLGEASSDQWPREDMPALRAHAQACENLPVFAAYAKSLHAPPPGSMAQ